MTIDRTSRWYLMPVSLAVLAIAGGSSGCRSEEAPQRAEHVAAATGALNPAPSASDFVLYAERSLVLREKAVVAGRDVGVREANGGALLVPGFEIAVEEKASVGPASSLLGDSVLLASKAAVGDVQTAGLTDQGATHGQVAPMPAMPVLPSSSPVAPGGVALNVPADGLATLSEPAYAAVTLGENAVLDVTAGVHAVASLSLGSKSKLRALGAAEVRVAGRWAVAEKAFVGPAPGVLLTAAGLRIEVNGQNGATGALGEIPKSASIGPKAELHALVLAPNGTLAIGEKAELTGAFAAREIDVGTKAVVTFQDGFPGGGGGCPPSCDDGNPCTVDACQGGSCVHAPVAAGTSCSDGNACNGAETCNGAGSCASGVPPQLDDGNACTTDACDPAAGVTHVPAASGTSCSDGNACNGDETCNAVGTCLAGAPLAVDDGNPCTFDACEPATGVVHTPVAPGSSCSDGNPCNGDETCDGLAVCVAAEPPTFDDANPCTTDGCDPSLGATHTPVALGTPCLDGNACNGDESCDAAGSCAAGTPPGLDDGNLCTVDACDPASGISHTPIAGCNPTPIHATSPFESRASLLGRVVTNAGTPVVDYALTVFDAPISGPARDDVVASVAGDGSFRARLTSFPDSEPAGAPPLHVLMRIESTGTIPVLREAYLHPGAAIDFGTIVVVPRDPAVTVIGPAGGSASDSQGLVQVVVPPGAVASPISVRVTPFLQRSELPFPLPHVTTTTYGFELEPDGQSFAQPVTVRVLNYRNLPTQLSIPTGYVDRIHGRWLHQGQATWDGQRFSFQTTHFTAFDCNTAVEGQWVISFNDGPNPNASAQACGAGSTVGYSNGSLRQRFELPAYQRAGRAFGATLVYDSGLAGSRKLGAGPSSTKNYDSVPKAPMFVPVESSGMHAFCVGKGGGGGGKSPGSCSSGGGRCSLGAIDPTMFLNKKAKQLGQEQESSEDLAPGSDVVEFDSSVELPVDDAGQIPKPGFISQRTEVSFSGGAKTCAGGGGTFGVQTSKGPAFEVADLESGPAGALERRILVHHRVASPFGSGWAIDEVSRLYSDPQGMHAVLVWGSGDHEVFRPRAFPTRLANQLEALARDPVTNEIFASKATGEIVKVGSDGTTTIELSGLAFGNTASSMAITYVGGQRHFLLAFTNRLIDVGPGSAQRVLETRVAPSGENLYTLPHVAASGDLALYTEGRPDTPVLYRFRLTDAVPVAEVLSAPTDGLAGLDPDAPVSGVTFQAPSGLAISATGSLYLADYPRHVVFELAPDANGEIGPTSSVTRAVGIGGGMFIPPLGERYPGIQLSLNQPIDLSTTADGTLWIGTAYGAAVYDPQSTEATWLVVDKDAPNGEITFNLLSIPSATILGLSPTALLARINDGTLLRLDVELSSVFEPTRTVDLAPNGATLIDTSQDLVETFDDAGRLLDRRPRSGEPMLGVTYVDADSDAIATLVDAVGGTATFSYGADGKLDAITDPTGRTTVISVDALGDLVGFTQPDGESYGFAYDAHHMTSKVSPRGDETQYVYDPDRGTIVTSTKPGGASMTFQPAMDGPPSLDDDGNVVRTGTYTDARGLVHTITVNKKGILHSHEVTADGVTYLSKVVYPPEIGTLQTQPGDPSTVYTKRRNTLFRPAHVLANGLQIDTHRDWDARGRLQRESKALGSDILAEVRYDASGRLLSYQDVPANVAFLITRDAQGRATKVADILPGSGNTATGRQSTFTWRGDGQLATLTQHDVTTTFAYDDLGATQNLLGSVDSVGRTQALARDPVGNVVSLGDGTTTLSFDYDPNNRPIVVEDGAGFQTTFGYQQTSCSCTEADQITSIHTPDLGPNQKWTIERGVEGRIVALTDPLGHAESYTYEPTGELATVVDRLERTTTMGRDQLGRLVSLVDTMGRAHAHAYPVPSAGGWNGPTVRGSGPNAAPPTTGIATALGAGERQVGSNLYQASGYPAQVEYYRDATFELSFGLEHDRFQRETQRQDRVGIPVASSTVIGGSHAYTHEITTYDPSFAAPMVTATTAAYSGTAETTSVSRNDELDVTSASGLNGSHDAGFFFPKTSLTFGRDVAGRVTQVDRQLQTPTGSGLPGPTTTYAYSPTGRLQSAQIVQNDASTTLQNNGITYDARGLVHARGAFSYEYDELGRNTVLTGAGMTRTQQWDAAGRLFSRCYHYDSSGDDRCYGATFNAVGNPLTLTDPEGTDTFTYDALDRVTSVTRTSAGDPDVVETYAYNALGALTFNADTPIDDQRPKLAGGGTAPAGVPAQVGGLPVTMDAAGRVTNFAGTSLFFNRRGLLRTVTTGATEQRFGYDAFLRRVAAYDGPTTNDGRFFSYEGANVAVESKPGGGWSPLQKWDELVVYDFDGVDHPVRRRRFVTPAPPPPPEASPLPYVEVQPETVLYEVDLAGNVRRLHRRNTGADLGGLRYTAFGKAYPADAKTPAMQVQQPLGWKGRPRIATANADLELYDMRGRIWSPSLGVFLTPDRLEYVLPNGTPWSWPGQNPVRWADPDGRCGPLCIALYFSFVALSPLLVQSEADVAPLAAGLAISGLAIASGNAAASLAIRAGAAAAAAECAAAEAAAAAERAALHRAAVEAASGAAGGRGIPPAGGAGSSFGPYIHGINKGGLGNIVAEQQLIATEALGNAGGQSAVRAYTHALDGLGPAPSTDFIEFSTQLPPSGVNPGQSSVWWAIDDGARLDIALHRIAHPDGSVTIFFP